MTDGRSWQTLKEVTLLEELSMKKVFSGLALGLMAISLVACSKSAPQPSAPPNTKLVQRSEVTTTVAKVVSVDLKARKLTVSSLQGEIFIVHVSKEAVNLPRVKKGDLIDISYGHELEVRVAEPGEEMNDQSSVVTRAKPGAKPQRTGVKQTNITAKILALDKDSQLAELQLADGTVSVVKVQNPATLEKVNVGDTLAISYLEVVDISVRKAAKR
jgi:hypothetical protein